MVKNLPAKAGDARDMGLIPELGRPSGVGNGSPVFLPGKIQGQRSLAGYNSWGHQELDTAECVCTHTHTHTQAQYLIGFQLMTQRWEG